MSDGKALVYNSNGRIYRFDLETKKNVQIDTGYACGCGAHAETEL